MIIAGRPGVRPLQCLQCICSKIKILKIVKITKTILTEDLEIHIIEIPKINRMLENGKLKKWILFLENPEGEETKRMAEKEKEIKEAIETLEDISSDETKERIAELRQKYIMDKKSELRTAKEIGIKEGFKKGLEEGSKNEKTEIVKKMLQENIAIEIITKITSLTQEEIEKIKLKTN